MLKALRHKGTQKKIYTFLAVAVVLSFVVSGVLISKDDKKTLGALAVIGKHPVTIQEYLDSYRAVQRQASFVYGDKLNEMRNRINFKGEAWDRLLLLDYARQQNLRANDAEVVQWLVSQSAFQSRGRFDEKLYALYVERGMRSTPRAFEEEIRQMLTIDKVQQTVRTAPSLTDDKLKELYQKEKAEKDLLYALLPWENFRDKVEVKDKDIEQLYTVVKDKLSAPEEVKVSYLFVPRERLESLRAALEDKTQTMEPLSRSSGIALKETGYFSRNDAVPEFGNAPEVLAEGFSLAPDAESAWIETSQGKYKVKLLDKKPEHTMTLEEAREELKKIYSRQTATELAVKKLTELKEKMKTADFEAILKAEGLAVTPLEKYHAGVYPAGIYPSENLQNAAEKLGEGGISDAFQVPKGAMIIKVAKVHPFDEKKFEQEKETFKKETSEKSVNTGMSELLEKLRKNLSMNLERMKELFPEGTTTP